MDPDFAFDDVEAQTTMWIPKDQLVDDVSVGARLETLFALVVTFDMRRVYNCIMKAISSCI